MSTKRTGTPKTSRGATETTTTVGTGLTAEEERALRMRFGLAGDDDLPLPDKAGGNAEVLAQLRDIERRAFAMTGRTPGEAPKTKSKIVSALKDKTAPAKKPGR
jgi:DNA-directed RNA polymerase sigma subunit (sigma70/sigma32)